MRFAALADTDALLELLFEQDAHDGRSRSSEIDAGLLKRNLFGEAPVAYGLVATRDDVLVGLAAFRDSATTFGIRPEIYLDDLFVRPAARRSGVARSLLVELERLARDRGAGRIRLDVAEENAAAIALYRSCGGELFEGFRGLEIVVAPSAGPSSASR